MPLALLNIHNLRNLIEVKVSLAPKFNLLYGLNGSGKTSFLEAIFYLGLGRSFRTRLNTRSIHYDAPHFSLFAHLQQENNLIPIGLERHMTGETRIRIAQENARSLLELTKILPVQLLNTDSRFLLTGSSKIRRQFIDWGVFHVEPTFITYWQQAQRILKQRNAALKQHTLRSMVQIWDAELEAVAHMLNQQRRNYLTMFTPLFTTMLAGFLGEQGQVVLEYKPGWDEEIGLKKALEQSWGRDSNMGYTHLGPQRAELLIRVGKTPAHEILSQGQQKLVVYAMRLAQGMLLKEQTLKQCVYLLDDLPAELDVINRRKVATTLRGMDAQVFITGVERAVLQDFEHFPDSKMFHVKHGRIENTGV
jgi:DNA replication and repair protein RecF